MAEKQETTPGKGALDIVEEAFHLLRQTGFRSLALYGIGTMPFVLGAVFAWADMSKSAFAEPRLPMMALLLSALFIWMKVWHVVYARELWAALTSAGPRRWTLRAVLRTTVRQAILQPWGLFALPVALVVALPFGVVYAFYQNLTVLDDGGEDSYRELTRRAWAQAAKWPAQCHILIWALSPSLLVAVLAMYLVLLPVVRAVTPGWSDEYLGILAAVYAIALSPLSPFGVVVAANLAVLMFALPGLLHALLGVQSVFVQNPFGMINSTFFALLCGLTYCCMDPLMKAAFVVRCFYGESRRTGSDLLIALKQAGTKGVPILVASACLLTLCFGAVAEEGGGAEDTSYRVLPVSKCSVPPDGLDAALDRELHKPIYAWRLPKAPVSKEEGLFAYALRTTLETIREWIDSVWRWAQKFWDWVYGRGHAGGGGGAGLAAIGATLRLVLFALLAILGSIVAIMLLRLWRQRRVQELTALRASSVALPDLNSDDVSAQDLPEENWYELARELAGRGELRLALRAAFLATLASLARMECIRLARFKSNRDYREELRLRAAGRPELAVLFSSSAGVFDRVWYGAHETTEDLLQSVLNNWEQLKRG